MRILHLFLAVFITALMLTAARDTVGRVALVVFITSLGEFAVGLAAVMTLFQTISAIGHSKDLLTFAGAVGATLMVLLAATATMNVILWIGLWILRLVAEPP